MCITLTHNRASERQRDDTLARLGIAVLLVPVSRLTVFCLFHRRRPRPSQSDLEEVPPEKLSQEAFRLLRTVQSLLNTREPDLAHRLSGSGSASGSGDSEPRSERSSLVSLDHGLDQPDEPDASPTPSKEASSALVADVTGALRRKLNIRNSQVCGTAVLKSD